MILAVDTGNTRVKGALVGSGRVLPVFVFPTASLAGKRSELSSVLGALEPRLRGIEGVAVCSVVPEFDRLVVSELRRTTGRRVLLVRSSCRFPFRVRVERPDKLGSDRLCAAAGAVGPRRRHAIIVDVGSAVTVDLVARGEFRGGLIMAGPALGLWALGKYARRLPQLGADKTLGGLPKRFNDTEPSMILGSRVGALGAVAEGVRLLRRAAGCSPAVFVTGGAARVLPDRLPRTWRLDPHLVSKGLLRVWRLNHSDRASR